ncbi:MAG: cytochrome c oxidase assembly protein [Acidimicrobiales bacterium]
MTALTLAHHPVAPSELWGAWQPDPLILGALALTGLAYRRGMAHLPVARRNGRVAPVRPANVVAFAGGLLVLAVALASPLELAAASLFSAHMVQHLLLLVVAAPLLVCGRPVMVLSHALPRRWRRQVGRVGARRRFRAAAHVLLHPAVVWAVGTAVLWAWHLPSPYEAALGNEALHALEHASLVATAALAWALALGRARRRLAVPAAAGLLFATALQSGALGAVLALARTPLYPTHGPVAPLWGLTALEDQQLAGGLMWVPPGLVYVVVITTLLARWFGSLDTPDIADRRSAGVSTGGWS